MKQTEKQLLGLNGEKQACAFLEKNGHTVIERNYRSGRSELDIISLSGSVIVVTEVKSFYKQPLGAAEFRVDKKKQQNIIRGVYGFLDENPKYQGNDVRLDVIIVDFSRYPAKITQYQGAYSDQGYN